MSAPFYVLAYYRIEAKDAQDALDCFRSARTRDVEYFEVEDEDGNTFDVAGDDDHMWVEKHPRPRKCVHHKGEFHVCGFTRRLDYAEFRDRGSK